jgi:RNA polymerase-binding transcription factor DksA
MSSGCSNWKRLLRLRAAREAAHDRGEFIDSAPTRRRPRPLQRPVTIRPSCQQVREALGRVAAGTFGTCVVDGGPIEEARLEAVPWTPYCLKHERRLAAATSPKTPSL